MKGLLASMTWPRFFFLRSVQPTTTTAPVVFLRQWAAVNTLSRSIKVPPQAQTDLPLRYSSKYAMRDTCRWAPQYRLLSWGSWGLRRRRESAHRLLAVRLLRFAQTRKKTPPLRQPTPPPGSPTTDSQ